MPTDADEKAAASAAATQTTQRAQQRFWRSIEDLVDAAHPAPMRSSMLSIDIPLHGRREFMKLMAASLALTGASGCSRPPLEKIVPYVHGPAQSSYGKPVFFASAVARDGYGTGVLVETNMGRPTKIEGNPSHPASLGATDIFAQASVLELWDPDRSKVVRQANAISTWRSFLTALSERMRALKQRHGEGLCLLTESVTSPTLYAQLQTLLERLPKAHWHQYQALNRDAAYDGARFALGRSVETRYRLDRARIVVALDADFLDGLPGSVRYARDFVAARSLQSNSTLHRFYAVESTPSLTGAQADRRLALPARQVEDVARALAARLGLGVAVEASTSIPADWLDAAVADLVAQRGQCLVIVGERQPATVHALAHAINAMLGNVGSTVVYTAPVVASPINQLASVSTLGTAMRAGEVDSLLMIGGNPAYDAPADLDFVAALERVPFKVHLGLYDDETAARSDWHVPAAHALETWSDVRAFDGTISIQQPCIAPLYGGKSAHELLSALLGDAPDSAHDIVRAHWQAQRRADDFSAFWQQTLHQGLVADSAFSPIEVSLRRDLGAALAPPSARRGEIELIFCSDPTIGDGRYANNAWLQELPKPLTKLTWDNAALVAPALAQRLQLANEDVVELRLANRAVKAPVWITPGQPDHTVTVALGYGRSRAGSVGNAHGFNANALRTSTGFWFTGGVELVKTGQRYALASTQGHDTMAGRDIVRVLSREEAIACKDRGPGAKDTLFTLYRALPTSEYAWAMSIDLNACIGCGACTVACQAENNIPVVGKAEVRRGREMHWIRVDRYYQGAPGTPRTLFMPVPCMQCEHAPCEVVCPVEASVHDAQGINVQVYNRCVGTRFCSNNCPYKVRRFNFLQYAQDVPTLNAQRNPQVTVRMRGVMEKCNYCLQRITTARIAADKEDRRIRDGEVVTACQAVCPTGAIVFGDLNDAGSAVNQRKASPLDYALLAELNTRPRTTYLPKIIGAAREIDRSGRAGDAAPLARGCHG